MTGTLPSIRLIMNLANAIRSSSDKKTISLDWQLAKNSATPRSRYQETKLSKDAQSMVFFSVNAVRMAGYTPSGKYDFTNNF